MSFTGCFYDRWRANDAAATRLIYQTFTVRNSRFR